MFEPTKTQEFLTVLEGLKHTIQGCFPNSFFKNIFTPRIVYDRLGAEVKLERVRGNIFETENICPNAKNDPILTAKVDKKSYYKLTVSTHKALNYGPVDTLYIAFSKGELCDITQTRCGNTVLFIPEHALPKTICVNPPHCNKPFKPLRTYSEITEIPEIGTLNVHVGSFVTPDVNDHVTAYSCRTSEDNCIVTKNYNMS